MLIQARPLFKDRKKFPQMVDPMLHGKYPMRGLYQALAVAAMCLQEQGETRPLIADVVTALTYLSSQTYEAIDYFVARPPSPLYGKKEKNGQSNHQICLLKIILLVWMISLERFNMTNVWMYRK